MAGTPKRTHQRLGAVVAGPDADSLLVEDRRHVVRVHLVEVERDDSPALVNVLGP